MSIHTNFIKGSKNIIFIGLNATEEAVETGAVFCTRKNFWTILKSAGFINEFTGNGCDYPYSHMAHEVFVSGVNCNVHGGVGFTDMVDDINLTSKKSNDVVVTITHLNSLKTRLEASYPKKIALLGKRVADEFLKLDGELKKLWGKRDYGYLGSTNINGQQVSVFVVPFPETTPISIKDKADYYRAVLNFE
jgi:hypothetical protein